MLCIPCLKSDPHYHPISTSESLFTKDSSSTNSSTIRSNASPYVCDKSGIIQNRTKLPPFEDLLLTDSIVRVSLTPTVAL
ncbi:hypothetical protein K493DRAFT_319734 [Basidiobolus meristosporus CBS 931.73]|uniref:Uncharacterized protein n=1 Tax=Basidiobolus meristosporus CBS 931.73 TaxID=1314790 RepID=A0A1Y1XMF1_9FUNG|nr:hypothetical protein K493DRAFT_319734 [Basidiobolus meristosporus CBS 931.73]|eukprot:ORX86940.1 hypothetical protein K493DRAFT_319734 [Basidiobolus meristosporus CBS 931.73]